MEGDSDERQEGSLVSRLRASSYMGTTKGSTDLNIWLVIDSIIGGDEVVDRVRAVLVRLRSFPMPFDLQACLC